MCWIDYISMIKYRWLMAVNKLTVRYWQYNSEVDASKYPQKLQFQSTSKLWFRNRNCWTKILLICSLPKIVAMKTQWTLLLTTFLISICSLIFVIVAFSVDKWVSCVHNCILLFFSFIPITHYNQLKYIIGHSFILSPSICWKVKNFVPTSKYITLRCIWRT